MTEKLANEKLIQHSTHHSHTMFEIDSRFIRAQEIYMIFFSQSIGLQLDSSGFDQCAQ